VEYLLGFSSMLNVSVKNKYGESPSEVARISIKFSQPAKKKSICDMLSGRWPNIGQCDSVECKMSNLVSCEGRY